MTATRSNGGRTGQERATREPHSAARETTVRCQDKHSTPDWTDVGSWVKAIEDQQDADVSILMGVNGTYAAVLYIISIVATKNGVLPPTARPQLGVRGHWPNRENRTIEGAILRLLMELDKMAEEKWGAPLPGDDKAE